VKPFYEAIAWLVTHIHSGLGPIFGDASGASWALSIVLLTVAMRLLLFPLFVKQIRNQRAMQLLQPKMKELQAKYKNDKEKLNQEMMALWREAGANPLSGCLPLIVQMPVFFALFRVLNSLKPNKRCTDVHLITKCFSPHYGVGVTDVAHAAQAKIFGVPISAAFNSSKHTLSLLGASTTSTKVLSVVLIVLMGLSTFLTQRQIMARASTQGGAGMPQQQKVLLYVLPIVFAVIGYRFPLGVLLYWLTTNVWSLGQQAIVIRRMDATAAAAEAGKAATAPSGPAPGAKPIRPASPSATALPITDSPTPPKPRPTPNRRPNSNNRKRRRRRGRP